MSVADRDLGLNLDNHTLNAGPGGDFLRLNFTQDMMVLVLTTT